MIVPKYEQQVSLDSAPTFRQQLDPRGSFGPDVQKFARDMDQLGQQYDEYAAKKAYTQYSAALADFVDNPDTGLMLRKGETVIGMEKDFGDKALELRKQFQGNLSKRAAARADEFMARTTQGYFNNIQTYQRGQMEATFNAQDKATVGILQGEIVRFRGQPEADTALQGLNATLDSYARRQGIGRGTDSFKALTYNAFEPPIKQAITSMLDDGDVDGAKAYLDEQVKNDRIGGDVEVLLRDKIENKTEIVKAQQAADSIMESGMDYPAALADARKKYSGKMRDDVVQRVKTRFAETKYDLQLDKFLNQQSADGAMFNPGWSYDEKMNALINANLEPKEFKARKRALNTQYDIKPAVSNRNFSELAYRISDLGGKADTPSTGDAVKYLERVAEVRADVLEAYSKGELNYTHYKALVADLDGGVKAQLNSGKMTVSKGLNAKIQAAAKALRDDDLGDGWGWDSYENRHVYDDLKTKFSDDTSNRLFADYYLRYKEIADAGHVIKQKDVDGKDQIVRRFNDRDEARRFVLGEVLGREQQRRRTEAQIAATTFGNPVQGNDDFLKSINVSMDEVKQEAKASGMTVAQVIAKLKQATGK